MNQHFEPRRQRLTRLAELRKGRKAPQKYRELTQPVFEKCPECEQVLPLADWKKQLHVCPACGLHRPIDAATRISMLLDVDSARELDGGLVAPNALHFPGYEHKLEHSRRATGLSDALVTVRGTLDGRTLVLGVLDSRFMMGSMGAAVGERLTRAAEYATKNKLPLVVCSASGGARMQEGILSLMQMAKTAAAIERHGRSGGLYISVLTHPTTGGVTASFASLGDIILAEPGALIGFAGPRVIEQTIGQTLPEGFQRAEYLDEHGFVDRIVRRGELRRTLSTLLMLHEKRRSI